MRIISLFPAGTEIAFAIGAGGDLAGVSHACDYPSEARERPAVTKARFDPGELSSAEIYRQKVDTNRKFGSLYRLDETAMWGCRANVVIAQGPGDFSFVSLHGVRAIAEGLNPRPEVVILFPKHIDDVLDDHRRVAFAVQRMPEARELVGRLRERIATVEQVASGGKPRRVAFLQWLDPSFAGGYWIPQLIEMAGGVDVLNIAGVSASRVHWPDLRRANPDVLVVACEDMSVERAASELQLLADRPGWWELAARRAGRVFVGDGPVFTRGGPRLVDALEALAWAMNPDRFPEPPPELLQRLGD